MFKLLRCYRIEVCWFLLLLAFMLVTPRETSSGILSNRCELGDEDRICDQVGNTCVCDEGILE